MRTNVRYSSGTAGLIAHALDATGLNQRQFGQLLGYHRRTIIRWLGGGAVLLPVHYEKIAVASYARDREFAAEMAARAGKTLVDLGLEKPPPPPSLPPATPPRPAPTAKHMADSIVCAAAEAMQLTPQAVRPGLVAAYERASALGMTAEEVLQALKEPVQAAKERGKLPRPSA